MSPVVLRFCPRLVNFTSFCSISFHLLSSSRFFSLTALSNSLTLSSSVEIWRRQEQSLAHSPQNGHLEPFPLLLTSSTQVSTLELELGSLDSCSLEKVRMCRITPHFVDLFVVRTPGARRTSVLIHILASLLCNDSHLNRHGSLVVELVHQLLPILLFLQCGVES